MTERLRANPYYPGEPRRASVSGDEGLGTKKTMLVLVVVVGCFAVLWPKLFYPMLVNNANSQMKPGPVDKTTGCCDVISELDLDTIKIMSELCSTIIDTTGKTPPSAKEIVIQCRKAVLETCGIDISAALQDRIVSLGHSVKQILEEVRSLNGSLCLKYNFGLSPWRLGVPHRVNINLDPLNTIRQERPTHLRSEMVHPAFKERGRAIPQPDPSGLPRRTNPPPRIVEGRPGPIPGMRPAMGGPGHMVAPSKHSNYGFMGVLMPIYTIGFVVFFTYTVMKLVFKRKAEAHVGAPLYPPCEPDDHFRKEVFEANKNNYFHRPSRDSSKVGDEELDQLRKRLRETELAMERIVEQMAQAPLVTQDEIKANGSLPKDDEQGTVKVMGMETTASCEGGKKWSRPDSPVLPHPHPVAPKEPSPPPQQIFLERSLPPQSQILVADSAVETEKDSEDDSPVVLAGKMTLSVISLDSETGTEDSSNSHRKAEESDEERRRSSSNVSEEFEKINAADLEDQINSIIEEAENIALTEENRYSPDEELEQFTEEILKAPQLNEKDKDNDVLEEIKNQLNLEDDLLLALKEKEPEGKINLPVTDLIKEFLSNEENALVAESKDITGHDVTREDIDVLERYKRSLDEEDRQEFEVNEDLKDDDDILDIIAKEVENIAVSENLNVSEQHQEDILPEEPTNLQSVHDQSNKEPNNENLLDVDTNDDQNNKLLQKSEQDLSDKELNLSEDLISGKIPQGEVTTTEDSCILEEADANLSKKVFNSGEQPVLEETLSGEREVISEVSQEAKEEINLEKEELKLSEPHLESTEVRQNLVRPFEFSHVTKEEIDLENNKLKLTKETEKTQGKVVFEDEVIQKENLGLSQGVVHLESSEKDLDREKTPEESSNNKADLLLQGLMVKEDEELNDQTDIAEHETTESRDEEKHMVQSEGSSHIDHVTEDLQERRSEESKDEEIAEKNVVTENIGKEGSSRTIDEDGLIDDEDYDYSEDDDLIDDEVRDINNRDVYEDRRESMERRINGEDVDSSRNGAGNRENAAENEISDEEDLEDEDDEEIEEIIEYVDNTDEEGEEIVEINGNEQVHLNENGEN